MNANSDCQTGDIGSAAAPACPDANRTTKPRSRFTFHVSRPTFHVSRFTPHVSRFTPPAFTLIELLIVISIIAILAAMIFPTIGAINKTKIRTRARGELHQLQAAIDRYHAKFGHYPPDNAGKPGLNQLYYELVGTTNNGPAPSSNGKPGFGTLGGDSFLALSDVLSFFGASVAGFVNSAKLGNEEAAPAQRFLGELRNGQMVRATYSGYPGQPVNTLVCTVPGTDPNPLPLLDVDKGPPNPPVALSGAPWRYNSSSPTNNPNSYDLWVDVLVAGKTNRISNWSTQPQVVGP